MRPSADFASPSQERVLTGTGIAVGVALGQAFIATHEAPDVPEYLLEEDRLHDEVERFQLAVSHSRHQLEKLRDRAVAVHGDAGEQVSYVLEAHLAMLSQSRLVRGVLARIQDDHLNAEAAVSREINSIAESFSFIDDVYLAARLDDVRIVGARLIRNLTKTPFTSLANLPPGTVLLGQDLTPADMAMIDRTQVVAFATEFGGAESHTAILARALGIPSVFGVANLTDCVTNRDLILVDGFAGTVTINPSAETVARFKIRCESLAVERRELESLRDQPAVTTDGRLIRLEANINLEFDGEVEQALEVNANGIGLVRTEFLYMNRETLPEEDEQAAILSRLVRQMSGRTVTIRTLDIGSDKLAYSLRKTVGESVNPALGLRGTRLSLRHRHLLETQFAAILRAAYEGDVRILLPMITSLSEVRQARQVLETVHAELRQRGVAVPQTIPPLGIMIEVPGTALTADAFAHEAAFFSLGTNDLTQYTLAIDRGDDEVAALYNPLHPAVLRLIQFSAEAAFRGNISISVCGEIAGDPRFTPLLIGLGIQALSMAPPSIPRVKRRVRTLSAEYCRGLADRILGTRDERRIIELLNETDLNLH